MREINFLTWNTQLYEMGNSINDEQPVKKIDMLTFNIVVEKVKKFLDSKNEAVAILQEILNHSDPSITLRYIGINQDEINRAYKTFCL